MQSLIRLCGWNEPGVATATPDHIPPNPTATHQPTRPESLSLECSLSTESSQETSLKRTESLQVTTINSGPKGVGQALRGAAYQQSPLASCHRTIDSQTSSSCIASALLPFAHTSRRLSHAIVEACVRHCNSGNQHQIVTWGGAGCIRLSPFPT